MDNSDSPEADIMRSRGCSLFFFFRFCLRSPMCKQYRIGSDSCQVNRKISFGFLSGLPAPYGEYTASRYTVYTAYVQ